MSKPNDLTAYAVDGYRDFAGSYSRTSPAWCAYELGKWFQSTGRTTPVDVRMGRGYTIRANDMRFDIVGAVPTFTRLE